MMASSKKLPGLLGAATLLTLVIAACGSDENEPSNAGPGTGGASGSSGTGGASGASGASGNAGRGGSGGTSAAGTGGGAGNAGTGGSSGGPDDGGPDVTDGGCAQGEVLRYEVAGCNAQPVCGSASGDACAIEKCSCRGVTIYGCGFTLEPIRHHGPCVDGGPDSGGD